MQERVVPDRRTVPTAARAPDTFAHAVLRTWNFDEMVAWYQAVLNARIAFKNDMLCFMTYDEEHHRIALIKTPGLPPQDTATARLAHLAYAFNELGDLLGTYKRLKAAGILPFRPINHGPTVSLYYRDPDGTAIELQVDVFDTKEGAQQFLESEAFRQNPIGVAIDPDQLLADYEAGKPEAEIKRRPDGPMSQLHR